MANMLDLGGLTAEYFNPLIRSQCLLRVPDSGGQMPLTLVSAKPSPLPGANVERRQPFSLMFHGPPDVRLPQGTYLISLPNGESMEVFIVPVAGDSEKRTYQAVFG
jgi:hypothetical protein